MKKILIICTAGAGTGGITTHIYNYISKLAHVVQIDIIQTIYYDESVKKRFEEVGCNVIKFPHRKKELCKYIKSLDNLLMNNYYDVVHVHGNSATMSVELLIAKIHGVKIRIAHCHTSKTEHPLIHAILNPFFKKTFTNAIACSEAAGNWIFGKGNYLIIKNAINANEFSFNNSIRQSYRKELNVDEKTLLAVQIGSLIPLKNCEFSIDIMRKTNQRIKLCFIGDGPEKEKLKSKIVHESLQDKIVFCGIRNDVKSILQAADILFMPSLYEGLPLTLIESQAAGVVCFVSENITNEAMIDSNLWIKNELNIDKWLIALTNFKKPLNRTNSYKKVIDCDFDVDSNLIKLKEVYGIYNE